MASLTDQGRAFLEEHRGILEPGESERFVALKAPSGNEKAGPGPLLRIVRRSQTRFYVDRDWVQEGGRKVYDSRIVGWGENAYVKPEDVHCTLADPAEFDAIRVETKVPVVDDRVVLYRREAAEIEALEAVVEIRARYAAEREKLSSPAA